MIYSTYNHRAFSVLRKQYNLPPTTLEDPDPFCPACHQAEMVKPKQQKDSTTAALQDPGK